MKRQNPSRHYFKGAHSMHYYIKLHLLLHQLRMQYYSSIYNIFRYKCTIFREN